MKSCSHLVIQLVPTSNGNPLTWCNRHHAGTQAGSHAAHSRKACGTALMGRGIPGPSEQDDVQLGCARSTAPHPPPVEGTALLTLVAQVQNSVFHVEGGDGKKREQGGGDRRRSQVQREARRVDDKSYPRLQAGSQLPPGTHYL